MIAVQNLTHRYGDRVALSAVSFEVRKGEIFGLLGPNGGGKSTLFRILSTMMVPTEGRAEIAGHDVARDPAAVRRTVGVVFQTQSLDKALTVEENLRAQGHLHGLSGAVLRDRMENAMQRLGLEDRRKDLVDTLSGGLRRRVEIAKALLHKPQVLLMDEASTGLDPAARRELSHHIESLRDHEGVTILLTTHILEEADRCDRLVLLHQGKIVAQGSPGELRSRIGGDVVVLETTDARVARRRHTAALRLQPSRARRAGAGRDRERPPLHRRSGGGIPRRGGFGGPAQAHARRCIRARNGSIH